MRRPKLKKASKRVSCAKRFKIQKKVREHNRKLRKAAKKTGISRKPKKDVGVPNSAPFKQEVLQEAEQRKQELEAQKQQNKLIKRQEKAKRKKDKKDGAETEPASKKAKKVEKAKEAKAAIVKQKSAKSFRCCELNKVIEASDVILEVLDARDPLGCRCPQLEETVLKHEGKKKLLFILNKIDLVPKENLEKWLGYLEAECPTFVFKASTQLQDRTVQQKRQRAVNGVDHSRAASCFGSSSLLQALNDMSNVKEDDKMLKVGVVGFPNVGKSSIINSLKEIRACHVGVQRGLTRCMQEVHISKKVKMIDSPGITPDPCNPGDVLALRSLQVEENEKSPLDAVNTLLKQCNQQHIMLQYNVPDYRNSLEFLTTFAKKRGFLQKGGVPNTELAATTFLEDWTGAKLSYHCRVPERQDLPSYLSDAIVTDLRSGLDMDKARKGNEDVIKGVRFPNLASSISFNSKGPTAGLLNVSETEMRTVTKADVEMDTISSTKEPEAETPSVTQIKESIQKSKGKPAKKTVKIIPVITDLTSMQQSNNNDAYDFNTDFV